MPFGSTPFGPVVGQIMVMGAGGIGSRRQREPLAHAHCERETGCDQNPTLPSMGMPCGLTDVH